MQKSVLISIIENENLFRGSHFNVKLWAFMNYVIAKKRIAKRKASWEITEESFFFAAQNNDNCVRVNKKNLLSRLLWLVKQNDNFYDVFILLTWNSTFFSPPPLFPFLVEQIFILMLTKAIFGITHLAILSSFSPSSLTSLMTSHATKEKKNISKKSSNETIFFFLTQNIINHQRTIMWWAKKKTSSDDLCSQAGEFN